MKDIKQQTSGSYYATIKKMLNRQKLFQSCNITHERRHFNFEAHSLANHASTLGIGHHVWLGVPYDPILVHVNILSIE